jgi:hypothetical protein
MVLLMNINDVSESVAGLAIALLVLMVCSSVGEGVKRFWPRHFFVMFYAVHLAVLGLSSRCKKPGGHPGKDIVQTRDKRNHRPYFSGGKGRCRSGIVYFII